MYNYLILNDFLGGIKLCLNQIKEDLQISAELMDAMKESEIFDRRRLLFTSHGISAIEAG